MTRPDVRSGGRRARRSGTPAAHGRNSGTNQRASAPPALQRAASQAPGDGPPPQGTPRGTISSGAQQDIPPRRLSLTNWPVSTRLGALFVAASLMGLVFGGVRIADSLSAAGADANTSQLAVLGQQVTVLAQDLENEQDLTVGQLTLEQVKAQAASDGAPASAVQAISQAMTTVTKELQTAEVASNAAGVATKQLAAAVGSAFPASVQAKAVTVMTDIGTGGPQPAPAGLAQLRTVDGQTPADIIEDYSNVLGDLFALNREISSSSGDSQLADEVAALDDLSKAKQQTSQQRAILYSILIDYSYPDAPGSVNDADTATGLVPYFTLQDFTAPSSALQDDLQNFQSDATTAQYSDYQAMTSGTAATAAGDISELVTSSGQPSALFSDANFANSNPNPMQPPPSGLGLTKPNGSPDPEIVPTVWYNDESALIGGMQAVVSQLAAQAVARSQMLQHEAEVAAVQSTVVSVLAVLLVLIVTALIARSMVNPLRRLQADALDIAAVKLPARVAAAASGTETADAGAPIEPIAVYSTDEIGRVARAFDQVHAEAVRLASNEAQLRGNLNAMFISLSRRSVPLIDRLARMIDALEQNEDDPDQLANLFSMDHLVTRMRRNSENLLVLAGEEPVRKWTEPVPLADVTRAAAAEIEQYARVALSVQPGIMISGQAVADVVHLLAELIENATLFSPRDTQVRVTAEELTSGGVLIEVRDDGVGVSASRLADMNWRLDHPQGVDVTVSRHMGLFAVSRLAERNGIRVRLRPGQPQGLSALVWLPGTLTSHEPTLAGGLNSRRRVEAVASSTLDVGSQD